MAALTDHEKTALASWAVAALTLISVVGILAGCFVGWVGQPIGAVAAVVTGAVGGIVAIVLRDRSVP